jgi:hypothetical protein
VTPYNESGCCGPHWFDVHAEVVFLRRDSQAPFWVYSKIITDPFDPGIPALTSADVQFDEFEPSFRITGTTQTGPGSNLEFTYLGLNDYSQTAQVADEAGNLFAVFDNFGQFPSEPLEGFHEADFQEIKLDTSFFSLELNYRRRWVGPTCLLQGSWLIGIRYFQLQDRLRFFSTDVDEDEPTLMVDAVYTAKTRNYMTGFQLGGDIWACVLPGLHVGLDLKAGLYGNNLKVDNNAESVDMDDRTPFFAPETLGKDKVSFVGEVGAIITYQLSHQFTLRGGYQMVFVEGVATAEDNFNPEITERVPFINDGDSLFYDGFTAGLECMW